MTIRYLTTEELDAGLGEIRRAPGNDGAIRMIVRRPSVDGREMLARAMLDPSTGLVGDNWQHRSSKRTLDGTAHPDMQLNIMNARVIALLAQDESRWSLAGDQLYIDMDLSAENLPAGTRLAVGDAVVEITSQPHTGCRKFSDRFGADATRWVNSEVGKALNLRGVNAKVLVAGTVCVGDLARKLPPLELSAS